MFFVNKLVKTTRKDDFEGEKLFGFFAGVTDHDSLVAGATSVDALGDFWGLFNDFGVDFVVFSGDAVDDFFDVNVVCCRSDFSGDKNDTVSATSFGSNASVGIGLEVGV